MKLRICEISLVAFGLSVCLAFNATSVVAQHMHAQELLIGKDQADPNNGNLKIEYPIEERVVSLDYTGFGGLFESTDVHLVPAQDDPPHVWEVDLGTEVMLEVLHLDPGVELVVRSTSITAPGSYLIGTHDDSDPDHSDLHQHPTVRLNLASSDDYGEGLVVFRLVQGTTGPGYGPSPTYVLRLTNGYPEPIMYDMMSTDTASLACQKALASEAQKYASQVSAQLRRCLDAVATYLAYNASGHPQQASKLAAAERACADASGSSPDARTLLGKLEALQTKAVAKVQKKCGTPGGTAVDGSTIPSSASNDWDSTQLRTHFGLVRCRTEETLAAAYGEAVHELENFLVRPSQGGDPLREHFPCMRSR
jgi:hypothetical protein